ncbi:MAG: hypothetical protein HQL35_15275 [Alphaproteobacteria bacterium]|nr:hypothetical protein [Alphaproteobacteria bacterium]
MTELNPFDIFAKKGAARPSGLGHTQQAPFFDEVDFRQAPPASVDWPGNDADSNDMASLISRTLTPRPQRDADGVLVDFARHKAQRQPAPKDAPQDVKPLAKRTRRKLTVRLPMTVFSKVREIAESERLTFQDLQQKAIEDYVRQLEAEEGGEA